MRSYKAIVWVIMMFFSCKSISQEKVTVTVIPLSTMVEKKLGLQEFKEANLEYGKVKLIGDWGYVVDGIISNVGGKDAIKIDDSENIDVKALVEVQKAKNSENPKVIFAIIESISSHVSAVVVSPDGRGRLLSLKEAEKIINLFPEYIADQYRVIFRER